MYYLKINHIYFYLVEDTLQLLLAWKHSLLFSFFLWHLKYLIHKSTWIHKPIFHLKVCQLPKIKGFILEAIKSLKRFKLQKTLSGKQSLTELPLENLFVPTLKLSQMVEPPLPQTEMRCRRHWNFQTEPHWPGTWRGTPSWNWCTLALNLVPWEEEFTIETEAVEEM